LRTQQGGDVEASSSLTEILFWDIIHLQTMDEKKRPTIEELTLRVYAHMDELIDNLRTKFQVEQVDYVLIENQPSHLNGTMKSIQMAIYNYFMLRRHWEGIVSSVHIINASLKLQGHGEYAENLRKNAPVYSKPYQTNKWLAVQLCKHYISHDANILHHFNCHRKGDDLADSILQAISWARKNVILINPFTMNI
jgi:hypothetical protein